MRTVKIIPVLAAALSVSGCGAEDDLPYPSSLSRAEDPRGFTVSVAAGAASVDDVRESARMPATRHCLETYGGSDVDWATDPATGDWDFIREGEGGDLMVFSGRCTVR